MLTPAAVLAAQPMTRARKLFDQNGLFLYVAPTGLKSWRMKYQKAGREQLVTLGRFPAMTLASARQARDSARERLRGGLSAQSSRGVATSIKTFESLCRAWHAHQVPLWSSVHAADVLTSLERDAFPILGALPMGSITAPDVLAVLELVEKRGCLATAKRLRQRLSAAFRYGIARGHCEHDPAAALSRALMPSEPVRSHPALMTINECRQLLHDCEQTDASPAVRLASRFLALTAVRLDAVRGMRWGEIEGMEDGEPIWRVPASRMKLSKAKKGDARFDHLVPLSRQALQVLRECRQLAEGACDPSSLVFPGSDAKTMISEGAIRQMYISAGYQGRHVPHGWRASFSTILNELLPEEQSVIDSALAHTRKDKVEAAYNRAEQLIRRRALFGRWGILIG